MDLGSAEPSGTERGTAYSMTCLLEADRTRQYTLISGRQVENMDKRLSPDKGEKRNQGSWSYLASCDSECVSFATSDICQTHMDDDDTSPTDEFLPKHLYRSVILRQP